VESAKQFNEEYKVTETVGNALSSGWSMFMDAIASSNPTPTNPTPTTTVVEGKTV